MMKKKMHLTNVHNEIGTKTKWKGGGDKRWDYTGSWFQGLKESKLHIALRPLWK